MMADLMHQDMGHDSPERFMMPRPVIEDGPPVEMHHIGHRARCRTPALRQSHPLKQSQEIEFVVDAEIVENLRRRKLFDPDDHIFAQPAKVFRQAHERAFRHRLDVIDRWRFGNRPVWRMDWSHVP